MKVDIVSHHQIYINNKMLDLNELWTWFNEQKWYSDQPRQTMNRLERLLQDFYGKSMSNEVKEILVNLLLVLSGLGKHLEDDYFYNAPKPVYRVINNDGSPGPVRTAIVAKWEEDAGKFIYEISPETYLED